METTRWWWVRHAPVPVPPGTIVGHLDPPADLSDRQSLTALARRLPPDAVWLTTPRARTRDTATTLLALRGEAAVATPVPELLEQDFGAWEGRTHAALAESDALAVSEFWQDPAGNVPPGGESFAAVACRVATAVSTLTAVHAGRDIVCIAHAGTIRAALGQALDLVPKRMLSFAVACLHLSRVDRIGDGWCLQAVNVPPCCGRDPGAM